MRNKKLISRVLVFIIALIMMLTFLPPNLIAFVRGSPRTYKALKNTLCSLIKELKENGSSDEQRETLQLIVKLLEGFKDNAELP